MHSLSVSFVERFCVLLLQHSQIQCESALDGLSKLCALATPFRLTLSSVLMSGLGEHVLTRANSSASLSVSLGHIRLAASSLLLSRPHPCRPPFFAPLCFLLLLSFRLFPFSPHYLRPRSLCCLTNAEQTVRVRLLDLICMPSPTHQQTR